jgi:hypothetical protein
VTTGTIEALHEAMCEAMVAADLAEEDWVIERTVASTW